MDGELISKIAESGIWAAAAVYLFILLMKEKDKRIQDAQSYKDNDTKLLRSIRSMVSALVKKAGADVDE